MAAMNNSDVAAPHGGRVAIEEDYRVAARPGARGGFPDLHNRRFRAAFYLAACGVAGVISTTVPGVTANKEHIMVYYVLIILAVVLVLYTIAAPDLPWLERAAARLEDMLF